MQKIKQSAPHIAIGFFIPLDFALLTSHMPFFQHELQDKLSYELTFNSYGKVIVSTDIDDSYTVSDIDLEYDKITSPEVALTLKNQQRGKYSVLYDRVQRHGKGSLNKAETVWNIDLSPNTKLMKGILILFIDPNDGGSSYDRDSEKFYNPKNNKVSITLDGNLPTSFIRVE